MRKKVFLTDVRQVRHDLSDIQVWVYEDKSGRIIQLKKKKYKPVII